MMGHREQPSPSPTSQTPELDAAIASGMAFLAHAQQPDGGFINRVWHRDAPQAAQANVFPAALIAHSLSFAAEGEEIRRRALGFLEKEKGRFGVWKHPTSGEYTHFFFPPDVDDTACAAAALRDGGRAAADSEKMLLANRDRRGLFYTWFTWRPRWAGIDHFRLILPQLRHAHLLVPLFTEAPCSTGNVDPVVNANALLFLGPRAETAAVPPYLLDILERGAEAECDPWYPGAFTVRYFFSRALAPWHDAAGALLRTRLARELPSTPLQTAFHLCACADWGVQADASAIAALLAAQRPSGGWPAEPFYRGGDYWWGSEALTTGFALEALARCRTALRPPNDRSAP